MSFPAAAIGEVMVDDTVAAVRNFLLTQRVSTEWCSSRTLERGRYPVTPETLVFGSVEFVHAGLTLLGVVAPPALGFPASMPGLLGRNVWRSTLAALIEMQLPAHGRLFVKPAAELKMFTGTVVEQGQPLPEEILHLDQTTELWLSDPVMFVAEWRCFVTHGEPVGVSWYDGTEDAPPPADDLVVEWAQRLASWTGLDGFCFDVGLTDDGRYLLVELNDGFALGSYDLPIDRYVELVWARWQQMVDGGSG